MPDQIGSGVLGCGLAAGEDGVGPPPPPGQPARTGTPTTRRSTEADTRTRRMWQPGRR